ncbi:MAG: MFS transporter [Eggerthellaceae bacterium]|jgi:MFS family permease
MSASKNANGRAEAPRSATAIPIVIAFGLIACLLYGFGAGFRSDVGILLQPLAAQCGLRYEDVSLCIAVMQIVFGGTQPFFGLLAAKRSNRFVLVLGAVVVAASLLGMVAARSFAALMLSLGIGFGVGAGALGFGLVLTSAIRFVGPERAMMISGMLNAAAGLVGFALSPILQALLSAGGIPTALCTLLVPVALLIPVAFIVTSRDPKPTPRRKLRARSGDGARGESGAPDAPGEPGELGGSSASDAAAPSQPSPAKLSTKQMFREAFTNRTFLLLIAGFTTCGFHMVIIESHLFNQYLLFGIDATSASWAFSIYGIATIVGALISGWLSARISMRRLLGFYYGFRAVWVLAFLLLMPKTLPFAVLFAIGLGITGDATVSPTSGLVNREFRIEYVATLIGVLFLCHQVGAFLSAWLGGVILDATGAYTYVWMLDIAACAFACIMSLRICEPRD